MARVVCLGIVVFIVSLSIPAINAGVSSSDLYVIQPEYSPRPFIVFCEMEIDGGGWTVILNRFDGSEEFYRNWDYYRDGFGNILREFWLGLEHIYELTSYTINELRIDLEDFDNQTSFAKYSAFRVGPQSTNYMLKVLGNYSGDAGDSFSYAGGLHFQANENSAAQAHHGAWYYSESSISCLTSKYGRDDRLAYNDYTSMYWYTFRNTSSLKKARMMIRPRMYKPSISGGD